MSGNIPVVQGFSVSNNNNNNNNSNTNYSNNIPTHASPAPLIEDYNNGNGGADFNGQKGEPQPKKFNDVFFAFLFYAHLGVMGLLLAMCLAQGGNNGDGGGFAFGMVYFCSVCGIFASGMGTVTLGFMMQFASSLIKISLFFQVGCSLAIGFLGLMSGNIIMAGIGFLSFLFGCCYAYFVWDRIPFAAANLNTALTAVRANLGLGVVAFIFLVLGFVWAVWWSIVAGTMMENYGSFVVFLFFLSYYWTQQVLSNTVHVTSAGVVGTWWFAPNEASSCCSKAIGDSFSRATTYSFGSICFGSLIVAVVQALRALNHHLRGNDDAQIIVCIIDCLLACIESIVEYFNKWAYVYVGLYGYSYLDAGKNVITLFQNKGWTTIITDDLAENVLFMMSIVIGLITGLVGMVVATLDQNIFANLEDVNPGTAGFVAGLLIGFIMASILMSVVASAVNTVIVCFAEAPREFESNHPQLSNEMRNAWRQAWPNECGNL
jgi:hypothetical protein